MKAVTTAAKEKPGQLKQSGGSVTSRDNVVRQLLQRSSGARWAFISFPGGGERIAALLGGHVNMMVIEPAEAGEHIRAGNMRVLAQVSDARLPAFPSVPTLKEAGFNVTPVPQVRGAASALETKIALVNDRFRSVREMFLHRIKKSFFAHSARMNRVRARNMRDVFMS